MDKKKLQYVGAFFIFNFAASLENNFDIFNIPGRKQFEKMALKLFRHQHSQNKIYRNFCDLLRVDAQSVKSVQQIPFLPISFFKTHQILSSSDAVQETFTSSGTTSVSTSRHHVTDLAMYENSYRKGFSTFYGNPQEYVILALLPSYLERDGSSLIYMVEDLIKMSANSDSGFYLNDHKTLIAKLEHLDSEGQNVILIGVTYALLDLIEIHRFKLNNTIVMETGGMKGRRKEIIRDALHEQLCSGFGVTSIHSEYGMTELLSQAYSHGKGIFQCPPWMKILIRDTEDPLSYLPTGKTGGINVIDLANINSCAFIATQDLGKTHRDGSFEVLGRFDNSDVRGCNLMVI